MARIAHFTPARVAPGKLNKANLYALSKSGGIYRWKRPLSTVQIAKTVANFNAAATTAKQSTVDWERVQ